MDIEKPYKQALQYTLPRQEELHQTPKVAL